MIRAHKTPEGYLLCLDVPIARTGGMIDLRNDPTLNMNGAESFGFGAMQGLGYNFGDEVIGGMAGATNALGLGDGTDARFATESAREMDRRAQENPLAYYGGMIPGAIGSSLAAGKALGLEKLMQGTTAQRATSSVPALKIALPLPFSSWALVWAAWKAACRGPVGARQPMNVCPLLQPMAALARH